MNIFNHKHKTLVPVHPDNTKTKDWLVLLEAATIVGKNRDRLRVALTTKDRTIRSKRRLFGRLQHYVALDEYDPRIHALYFCPQLYKSEDGTLVPLSGQEIGELMAKALEKGAIQKAPWYQPADSRPDEPAIKIAPEMEFDSLVVDAPSAAERQNPKSSKTVLRAVAVPGEEASS